MRLVEHSYWQRSGNNFDKTLPPLVSIAAVHLVVAVLGGSALMIMKYLDITTAFLESNDKEEIYVTLPKRVVLFEGRIRIISGTQVQVHMRQLKSLYSLKQVSLNRFQTLDSFLSSIVLQKLRSEPAVYVLRVTENQILKAVLA